MVKAARPKIKMNVTAPVDSRMPTPGRKDRSDIDWAVKGELFLNCSCTVFCPCVISLGAHPPTEGDCKTWMAIQIDKGHYGSVDLSGINVGLLVEIPGRMGEGNWSVMVYVDDKASYQAMDGILKILSGKAGGTTGVLKMLIGQVIGAERTPVVIEREGSLRRIMVGKKIQGEIAQVMGHNGQPVKVVNTRYWMGPDIFVAHGTKSRVRAKGRVWDFSGKSAEICEIDWSGPDR